MLTFSAPLDAAEIAALEQVLAGPGFESRTIQHALFSGKGEGVICTVYKSGKCVVQGKGTEQFLKHHLPGHAMASDEPTAAELAFTEPAVGSDESGKGDYFGPLVTAAVVLAPDDLPALAGIRLTDSKKMTPRAIIEAAKLLRETVAHTIVTIMPARYNELYAKIGNLNRLLAWSHGTAIEEALGKRDASRVVIDRFCDEGQIRRYLKEKTLTKELEIRPRAEDHPAVAAASILATDEFRRRLAALGREADLTLPKGSGAPVKAAAKRIVGVKGTGVLHRIAKVHFSITEQVSS